MVKLTELPLDILYCIFLWLSPFENHGLPYLLLSSYRVGDFLKSLSFLARLCHSCKTLRHVAQSILYRFPIAMDFDLPSLVRTLAKRRDLAQQVRGMVIKTPDIREEYTRQHRDISSEDVDLFNSMIATHSKTISGDAIQISQSWYQRPGKKGQVRPRDESHGEQDKGLFCQQPEPVLTALLLTQVPNILGLQIEAKSFLAFPFCMPGSLPRLTKFRVKFEPHIGEVSPHHLGTNLVGICDLLAAAPALDILDTWDPYMASIKTFHNNLTELVLADCAASGQAFRTVLKDSERLQYLSYESAYGSVVKQPTLPELLDAILLRADTLRGLDLYFEPQDGGQALDVGVMEALKDMTVFENLTLNLHGQYEAADLRLHKILPPTIREFANHYPLFCFQRCKVIQPVLDLANYAPVKFPNLTSVCFGLSDEESDDEEAEDIDNEIRAAFEKHGIVCILK